ncbi:hypothetical protein CcaCcLH18_03485 [Colletotrichum camelliae]|nr:hypothetical protein CcaCcLH18_03485 [Colletotrichum camelliae]
MSPINFRWEQTKVSGQIVGFFAKGPNHGRLGIPIGPPAISMLDIARPDLSKGLMQSALETGHVQVVFHKELVAILDDDSNGSNVMVSVQDLPTGLLEEQMASFLMIKGRLAMAVDTKELAENIEQVLLSEEYISFDYDRA